MLKGEKLYLKKAFPKKCESLSLSPKSSWGELKKIFDGKFFVLLINLLFGGEGKGIFNFSKNSLICILLNGKQVNVKHNNASEILPSKNETDFENKESTLLKSSLIELNSSELM